MTVRDYRPLQYDASRLLGTLIPSRAAGIDDGHTATTVARVALDAILCCRTLEEAARSQANAGAGEQEAEGAAVPTAAQRAVRW